MSPKDRAADYINKRFRAIFASTQMTVEEICARINGEAAEARYRLSVSVPVWRKTIENFRHEATLCYPERAERTHAPAATVTSPAGAGNSTDASSSNLE
jgi:hypothetical protein